jgi:protein SCO1/2
VKKALLLALVLVVPAVAYLVLQTGENRYEPLPVIGPREPVVRVVNGKSVVDTVYHTVGDFNLIDSDSLPITQAVARGKISVVDFFFSTCATICPKMSNQMMRVQHKFKDDKDVVILSFTVDPTNDTPSRLKAYGKEHQAISGKWFFITGEKEQIYRLAKESYFLNALETPEATEAFLHSEKFMLIDKQGRIRGIYDGTEHFEVKRLIEDIEALQQEVSEVR